MFFDDKVNEKDVESFAKLEGLLYQNAETRFNSFCIYYALKIRKMPYHESLSFGFMAGAFLCNKAINYGTDDMFMEKKIQHEIGDRIEQLGWKSNAEVFSLILEFYENEIDKFSYKRFKMDFRISHTRYEQFMKIKGESKSDKLYELLDYYYSQKK